MPQPPDVFDSISQQPTQQGDVFDQAAQTNGPNQNSNSPTPAQLAYRKAVAAGPYAPAGAAERAMGAEFGNNQAQAIQSAKSMGNAALETAGGVTGAASLGLGEALPSVLAHTVDGVKAIGAWAGKNPVQAYLLFQVMKELVPGAKKALGIVKDAPEFQ